MPSSVRSHLAVVPDLPPPLLAVANRVQVPGAFSLDPWTVQITEPLIDGWASGRVTRPAILSLLISTALDCQVNGDPALANRYLIAAAHVCAVCDADTLRPEESP